MLLTKISEEFQNISKIMVNCTTNLSKLNVSSPAPAKNAKFVPIPEPGEQIQIDLENGEDLLNSDGGHRIEGGNEVFGNSLAKKLQTLRLDRFLLPTK